MKHLTSINRKAAKVEAAASPAALDGTDLDVIALQQNQGPPQQPAQPHIPLGCSLVFSPGWEADRTGGTAGLCQPVERDLFDCHTGCYWPAHVPDQLNHAPDWTSKCAAAAKDWRKIDLVFP
jgi:hypothetical protein